jgi:histone-lysine N-methyltransferase SETMAR
MLIVFFDRKGVIYRHFFPRKTTVTGKAYLEVLKGLKRAVDRKRPKLSDSFILLHDKARPHKTSEIRNFLAENSIEELPHPPYSPVLAPCDFRLFPKLKNHLVGKGFQSDPQLKRRVNTFLNRLSENEWSAIFEELVRRWEQCFNENGIYFE